MSGLKQTVLGVIGSRIMAQARVDDVDVLSKQFRMITLSSEKFKGAAMQPAAKVRLNAGNWEMRAYTPLAIDAVAGRVQILAYLHGEGPGSTWARSAVVGDATHVIGPEKSLALTAALTAFSQPVVFFGDETSLAAAKTLQVHLAPRSATRFIFELSKTAEARAVAEQLELNDIQCYDRQTDDAHIPQVAEAIRLALASLGTSHLVLTGNGRSIQAIRASLRTRDAGVINYHVKAYWAPGKFGLE